MRYWQARAFEKTGDKKKAIALYHFLAQDRTYYGFLASERLGRRYHINHAPVTATLMSKNRVHYRMALRRIQELYHLGYFVNARRELYYLTKKLTQNEKETLAKTLQSWNWHEGAIKVMSQAESKDDVHLRFPLAFPEQVFFNAQKYDIDPAWLFAMIRQESAFAPDAQSAFGAYGIMQLMPKTAKAIAKEYKIRYHNKKDLMRASVNMRIGSAYLRKMLNQHHNNMILALAAYNAGPQRITDWLKHTQSLPFDIWIDYLPNRETRNYLQNILTFAAIYTQRLGAKASIIYPS